MLLHNAIGRNPRLYDLATRPLLLTLMASLHAWWGGTLPDQREALYADAVDLLLDQWERQKAKRRGDGTYELIWREVTLLAGAKAARGAAFAAWTLANALCFTDPPTQRANDDAGYWGALLATQVLNENNSLDHIAEHDRPTVVRIRKWLTCTLTHDALSPVDRAQADDALAAIGDLRFRTDAWYLPDEPFLGFVEILAGPF